MGCSVTVSRVIGASLLSCFFEITSMYCALTRRSSPSPVGGCVDGVREVSTLCLFVNRGCPPFSVRGVFVVFALTLSLSLCVCVCVFFFFCPLRDHNYQVIFVAYGACLVMCVLP